MENITQKHTAHVLAVVYPVQGHICPMLQFCRRLVSKGAESAAAYLARFETVGSQALGDLIEEHLGTHDPITCIMYDAFLPWGLNVAKKYGIFGAAFFTQPCGLTESYPAYLELVLNQYSNLDEADFVLVNTIYELEEEIVDVMSKECPLLTIGPTIPSFYVDKRIPHDKEYGLSLYPIDPTPITKWLSTKSPKSVVYVSFGSMACLTKAQIEELAWGLKQSKYHFLWVVRASEEHKLPNGFADELAAKGLIVRWCPQLEVLSSEAIGCFFTHCGWNSTLEALVLSVPLIGMPQWTDQPMVAKLVEGLWKVGVRVKVNEEGLIRREEIVERVIEVMEEKRVEFIENAKKWLDLMKKAMSKGGSSDRNIDEFISKILRS
uniref:Glycosyltransferase n=2 Tax=Chenopodium quinoa TaxID=63459 RepID=A0A803M5M9_CHEQI